MTTIDQEHELAALDGGFWPGPGCYPQPWPPFPGPIWDATTNIIVVCWDDPLLNG